MAPGNSRTESESGRDNASNDTEYNRDSIGNENVHNRENPDSRDETDNRSARSTPSTGPIVNSKLKNAGDSIRSNRPPTSLLNDEVTHNPDSLDNIVTLVGARKNINLNMYVSLWKPLKHHIRVEVHPVPPQNLLGISVMGVSEEE